MLGKEGIDWSRKPIGCALDGQKKGAARALPLRLKLTDYIFERDMPPPIPLGIFIVPLIQSSGLFG